jgi:phage shock protein C
MSDRKRGDLRRDVRAGKVGGVCAGIADYFGVELWLVRIFAIIALIFAPPPTFIAYCAAWFILDPKINNVYSNGKLYESQEDILKDNPKPTKSSDADLQQMKIKQAVWQAGETPKQALADIKYQFTKIQQRVVVMETYVTSPKFTIEREINRL